MLVSLKHFVKVTGLTYLVSFSGDIAFATHFNDVKRTFLMYLNKIQSIFSSNTK
ncbi:hypothetical protein J0801_29100 [Bacillus cereus]|uniref:Uncharacterized protein n=1 Tax=Bacillus thuringiensis TaxID=1428 RepID=A0A9X5N736_BACTU|nr:MULTISPECIES: hypothetical protein [Bacillus cereus group]OFC94780.1 hypothetical protein BTGOE4_09620 [Bacillus thuringiensis]SME73766.1 hypothetical protein BACERE00198_05390 [Bacillus cereus]